jgi:hypothetical protein
MMIPSHAALRTLASTSNLSRILFASVSGQIKQPLVLLKLSQLPLLLYPNLWCFFHVRFAKLHVLEFSS